MGGSSSCWMSLGSLKSTLRIFVLKLLNHHSVSFFLCKLTLFAKYIHWPSPSDSNGISDLKVVDSMISESEGFNLLLEPLLTKIIFPLWNGTGIHCELTSINLSLPLRKADEVWFCCSAQPQRANYGKNLIYRRTSKALEWDVCLFTLLPFILHHPSMLPAHGFESLFGEMLMTHRSAQPCWGKRFSLVMLPTAPVGGPYSDAGMKPRSHKRAWRCEPRVLAWTSPSSTLAWYLVRISSCNPGCVEAGLI